MLSQCSLFSHSQTANQPHPKELLLSKALGMQLTWALLSLRDVPETIGVRDHSQNGTMASTMLPWTLPLCTSTPQLPEPT